MPLPTLPGLPRWSSPCRGQGAYPIRSSNQSVSTRTARPSVAAKVVGPTDLLDHNVKIWVNTDWTRLERPSLIKAPLSALWQSTYVLAVHLVTVHLRAVAGRLPRLLLVVLPSLINTLAQLLAWGSLLWLSVMWRQRYLTQSNFLSTTSLALSLALHLLFCFNQQKPLQWKEINTHTHTHTCTHTLPGTVVYRCQVYKGEVLSRHRYKESRIFSN